MNANLIYYEYECAHACTPTGCHGHEDKNIIVGIEINDVSLLVEGHESGEYPISSRDHILKTNKAVNLIYDKLKREK